MRYVFSDYIFEYSFHDMPPSRSILQNPGKTAVLNITFYVVFPPSWIYAICTVFTYIFFVQVKHNKFHIWMVSFHCELMRCVFLNNLFERIKCTTNVTFEYILCIWIDSLCSLNPDSFPKFFHKHHIELTFSVNLSHFPKL